MIFRVAVAGTIKLDCNVRLTDSDKNIVFPGDASRSRLPTYAGSGRCNGLSGTNDRSAVDVKWKAISYEPSGVKRDRPSAGRQCENRHQRNMIISIHSQPAMSYLLKGPLSQYSCVCYCVLSLCSPNSPKPSKDTNGMSRHRLPPTYFYYLN